MIWKLSYTYIYKKYAEKDVEEQEEAEEKYDEDEEKYKTKM